MSSKTNRDWVRPYPKRVNLFVSTWSGPYFFTQWHLSYSLFPICIKDLSISQQKKIDVNLDFISLFQSEFWSQDQFLWIHLKTLNFHLVSTRHCTLFSARLSRPFLKLSEDCSPSESCSFSVTCSLQISSNFSFKYSWMFLWVVLLYAPNLLFCFKFFAKLFPLTMLFASLFV